MTLKDKMTPDEIAAMMKDMCDTLDKISLTIRGLSSVLHTLAEKVEGDEHE